MSSSVIYSNAFKLKTELNEFCDLMANPNTANPTIYTMANAKLDSLERTINELQELGKREVVKAKRDVVAG